MRLLLSSSLFLLLCTGNFFAQVKPITGQAQSKRSQVHITDLPPSSNRYAILVGVDKYDDGSIGDLSSSANDVWLMQDALIKYAGFSKENIKILTSSAGKKAWPDRNNILTAISRIKAAVEPNSLLLFMFSGHGITHGSGNDAKAILLPKNAIWTTDVDLLQETSLPVDLIRERIAATKVGQAIILLDSCRDSPGGARSLADNVYSVAYHNEFDFQTHNEGISATLVFFAASIGQRAFVDPSKQVGYFTEAVVEGLEGKAADQSGNVTLEKLLHHVQLSVPTLARETSSPKIQYPEYLLSGFKATDLIISHIPTTKTFTLDEDILESKTHRQIAIASKDISDMEGFPTDEILLASERQVNRCDRFFEHTEARLRQNYAIMDDISMIAHDPPGSRKMNEDRLKKEKENFYRRQVDWWTLVYANDFAKAYFMLLEALPPLPDSGNIGGMQSFPDRVAHPDSYSGIQFSCSSLSKLANRYQRELEIKDKGYSLPSPYSEAEKKLMAPR